MVCDEELNGPIGHREGSQKGAQARAVRPQKRGETPVRR